MSGDNTTFYDSCCWLFCLIATVKDLIDYYYDYLLVDMDGHIVAQLMVSQQLLNKGPVMNASNDYQKNCLILQQLRLMDMQALESFGEMLLTDNKQKHVGKMLINGE